jgi:hypothetical protein
MDYQTTDQEARLIILIAGRASKLAGRLGVRYTVLDADMDLTAVHVNGCKLRLQELLNADEGNFGHDVFGIRRHIDRKTGKLGDCFLPRYAAPRGV